MKVSSAQPGHYHCFRIPKGREKRGGWGGGICVCVCVGGGGVWGVYI